MSWSTMQTLQFSTAVNGLLMWAIQQTMEPEGIHFCVLSIAQRQAQAFPFPSEVCTFDAHRRTLRDANCGLRRVFC